MRKLIAACVLSACLLMPSPAFSASVDMSNGGVEVADPSTIILHNALVGPAYYSVTFQWHPLFNVWYVTDYGPENPTFSARQYFPLMNGSSWTYVRSSGGTLTLTTNGTEWICGRPCIRLSASDGGATFWISDETGVWMTRYANPDGSATTYCPPMKISPAQMYLGTQELSPFEGNIFGDDGDIPFGRLYGWSTFTVKGMEDVTVPAGTFSDCFRATFVYSFTDTWIGTEGVRTDEAWYARGIGIVRRIVTDIRSSGGTILSSSAETYQLQSFAIPE